MPSPTEGILGEINFEAGSTVEVGATLGSITEGQSVSKNDKIEKIKATVKPSEINNDNIIKIDEERDTKLFDTNNVEENLKNQPKQVTNQEPSEEPLVLTEEVKSDEKVKSGKETIMSPAVRKIVKENNINIENIKGSGKGGLYSMDFG